MLFYPWPMGPIKPKHTHGSHDRMNDGVVVVASLFSQHDQCRASKRKVPRYTRSNAINTLLLRDTKATKGQWGYGMDTATAMVG